jgi:hypothetical protein
MKILDAIKRRFGKKTPLTCGSFNTVTGEYSQGFKNALGEIIYKVSGKTNTWGEAAFYGTVTFPVTTHFQTWFTAPREVERRTVTRSLYKQTNIFSKANRYFFEYDGEQHFIDTNAFEQMNQVIPL